jgi:hypothetical protein
MVGYGGLRLLLVVVRYGINTIYTGNILLAEKYLSILAELLGFEFQDRHVQ